MTYSIVAHDSTSGTYGVAVASRVLACGAGVPAVTTQAAAASQARAAPGAVRQAIEMLRSGQSSAVVGEQLMALDASRAERQMGIVDARGLAWTYTGSHCFAWAGGRTGPGFAVQGNLLAGPEVVDAIAARFISKDLPFRELLVAALAAGQEAGGDARGAQSAALQTARPTPLGDELVDLRVDDHPEPVAELKRLVGLYGAYGDVPAVAELVPLDPAAVRLMRIGLTKAGMAPNDPAFARMTRGLPPRAPLPAVGDEMPFAPGWTAEWQRALIDWMEVENLELRVAAPGWIDPRTLERLRIIASG